MKEDEYNIVCKGELLPGVRQSAVMGQIVKLFKVDEAKALQILSKKPKLLKKRLSWSKASRYQEMMKKIGLVTYVDLVLDADIFRESLLPVPINIQADNRHTTKEREQQKIDNNERELQLLRLGTTRLIPAIFAGAQSESVVGKNKEPEFTLESYNHFFSPTSLLFLSIFVSIVVQNYFGLLLVQVLPSTTVTPLLIMIFFLTFAFLPKIMTPARVFTLTSIHDGSPLLLCAQELNFNPLVDLYHIYSNDDKLIAKIIRSRLKNKIECRDALNTVLFTSAEEKSTDDVLKDVSTDIRDGLFDIFNFLSYSKILFGWLKKVRMWYRKEQQDYQRSDMFVVRDSAAQIVGYFHRGSIATIEYPEIVEKKEENLSLIAVLLICLGVA